MLQCRMIVRANALGAALLLFAGVVAGLAVVLDPLRDELPAFAKLR